MQKHSSRQSSRVTSCVGNVFIHVAHYTPVNGVRLLHGHTYEIRACISGRPGTSGFVADFVKLKELLERVTSSINYSLLAPKRDFDKITFSAPGATLKVFLLDGEATAENLAKYVCEELVKSLNKIADEESEVEKLCVEVIDPSGFKGMYCLLMK